jgi:hypothetical protein
MNEALRFGVRAVQHDVVTSRVDHTVVLQIVDAAGHVGLQTEHMSAEQKTKRKTNEGTALPGQRRTIRAGRVQRQR